MERRRVAVGASAVAHIIHSVADVEVREQVELVADVALEARVEVAAVRPVERRILAEISEAVENRDRADRIVERITRGCAGIAGKNRQQVGVVIDGGDYVQAVRTGDGWTVVSGCEEICLYDAMNRSAEADGVKHLVNGAAVVAGEEIALNRLPRTQHARPVGIGSDLHVERRLRKNQRIVERWIDRVHHLLVAEARAVYIATAIPIQAKRCGRNIDLVAKIRLAIRGADFIGIVVAEPDKAPHVIVEVVIQARGQHVFAEIGTLQAISIEGWIS